MTLGERSRDVAARRADHGARHVRARGIGNALCSLCDKGGDGRRDPGSFRVKVVAHLDDR